MLELEESRELLHTTGPALNTCNKSIISVQSHPTSQFGKSEPFETIFDVFGVVVVTGRRPLVPESKTGGFQNDL